MSDKNQNPANADHMKTDSDAMVEQIAIAGGWRPEDQYHGPKDGFIPAPDFVKNTFAINDKLRKSVKKGSREVQRLGKEVSELKKFNSKFHTLQIKRLKGELDALKAEKKEAIEEGDTDRVENLDSRIDEIREVSAVTPPAAGKEPQDPAFEAWQDENPWYDPENGNKEMMALADATGEEFNSLSYERMLPIVDKRMREAFPEKFQTAKSDPQPDPTRRRQTPSPVEGVIGKALPRDGVLSVSELSFEERGAMQDFTRRGLGSEQDFLKAYSDI